MMMDTGNKHILTSCENRGLKRPEITENNDFFEVKPNNAVDLCEQHYILLQK